MKVEDITGTIQSNVVSSNWVSIYIIAILSLISRRNQDNNIGVSFFNCMQPIALQAKNNTFLLH
jgi:hypothetical protein